MNLFILSDEPRLCAEYHSDVHLNSQLKEAVQVLSTVYGGPYKPTHQNHPCTKWVAASPVNAAWALTLAYALHAEWLHRHSHVRRKVANEADHTLRTGHA